MDSWVQFETEIYPRLWVLAYNKGMNARDSGYPRICNLDGEHCHNGNPLKVYKSAWEQGWDRYSIAEEFRLVEALLAQMPLRPLNNEDSR